MTMPRVAVVGGSLAGLTAGLVLRDAGCEVDIYERSRVPLSGLGAGIVVQPESVRYLEERAGISAERISAPSSVIRYVDAGTGSLIGEVPRTARYTNYNALYRVLLSSFGTERYHLGQALVGLELESDGVGLRFANGSSTHCDLAVCADGGFSTARQRLLGVTPKYSGYISWRGLADRSLLSAETSSFFEERFTYGVLPDSHIIAYPIPVVDDELTVRGTQVNFQWYWWVKAGPELDEMMTGKDGVRRPVTVHAADVAEPFIETLRKRARKEIAVEPLAELITTVPEPFVTVIADTETPQMVIDRVCLIGDAAVTARPHAGAGGAKAAADAWALAEAIIETRGDVDEALRLWEPMRLQLSHSYLVKARHMARLLQGGGRVVPGDPGLRWGLTT